MTKMTKPIKLCVDHQNVIPLGDRGMLRVMHDCAACFVVILLPESDLPGWQQKIISHYCPVTQSASMPLSPDPSRA